MILVDYRDTRPIYEQIVDKYKMLILRGVLRPDDKLPSVRNLAVELSINPNTIQRAYAELERQGYIYTVKGKGNFVSDSRQLFLQYQQELFVQLKAVCKAALEVLFLVYCALHYKTIAALFRKFRARRAA